MTPSSDVAALSAGIIAVALSLIEAPGRYDAIDLMISLSLILLFAAYVIGEPRGWPQRVAVSAIVALAVLPVFGFVYQKATGWEMNNWWHIGLWLTGAMVTAVIDWWRQRTAATT